MSVLGLPKDEGNWRKPPFIFENPDTGEREEVNDYYDFHRIFNGWSSDHFEFGVMLAPPSTFIDSGIQNVIKRLQYCERFHVPPFPGDYTEHPDWWKKAVIIMDKAFEDAEIYRRMKQKV